MAKETDLRAAVLPSPSRDMRRLVIGLAAVGTGYLVHRLGRRSGVSNRELRSMLPGDEIVPRPRWQSTRGTTIAARPDEVWPWIAQMGFPAQRAGWYTPHLVDRLTFGIRERSADRVRPELQELEAGDRIPDSADWSVFFTVAEMDPPHALVLHSTRHVLRPMRTVDFSWAFVLEPVGEDGTRLLIRARTTFTPAWAWPLAELVIGPADYVNVLGMFRGIKGRVEGGRRARFPVR